MSTPPSSPLPSLTQTSSDGRCGMCGACGSMPPWAPEMLVNATPAARLAIQQRMEEARLRFIKQRNDTIAANAKLDSITTSSSSSSSPNTMHKHQDRIVSPIHQTDPVTISMSQLSLQSPTRSSDAESFRTAECDDLDHLEVDEMIAQMPTREMIEDMFEISIDDDDNDIRWRNQQTSQSETTTPTKQSLSTISHDTSDLTDTPEQQQDEIEISKHFTKKENNASTIESLEGSVSSRPTMQHRHISNDPHFNNFDLPPELHNKRSVEIQLQSESSLVPRTACADCEIWRARVQELELRVEALTSALAAREMEHVALRARVSDRIRHIPKSEARLAEECESLRVTTEFLVS